MLLVSTTFALATSPSRALAGWTGAGLPIAPPSPHAVLPATLSDGAGGWYVAWVELPLADVTAGDTVFVQRLDANGDRAPGWPERGVRLLQTGHAERLDLVLGADGALDVIETWTPSGEFTPVSQHRWVLPDGTLDSPLRAQGVAQGRLVASDGAGGSIRLSANVRPSHAEVVAERRRASGEIAWSRVVFDLFGSGGAYALGVTADGAGGAYLLWFDATDEGALWIARVDSTGASTDGWATPGLALPGEAPLEGPEMLSQGEHGVMLVWRSSIPCLSHVALVSAAGHLTLFPTPVTESSDCAPGWRAISDGDGGAIVVWRREESYAVRDLFVQTVDATGFVTSGAGDGLAVCEAPGDQELVNLLPDGAGGAYVVWRDPRTGVWQNGVQRLDGTGSPVAGWPAGGRAVCPTATGQGPAAVARDAGGLTLVWPESREAPLSRVYATRITLDGATPTLASCVQAEATRERVRLRWYAAAGPTTIRVGRARDGAAWFDVGAAVAHGRDEWTFEDTDVTPGERRAYRLQSASGVASSEVTWVTVPTGAALSIAGLVDEPAEAARVRLVLASAEPARLEAYDVAGRRVAGRALSGLAAGEHVVDLALPPGAGPWFLRLAQGGAIASRRVVRSR